MSFVAYGGIIKTVNGVERVMINNYPDGWDAFYMDSGYMACDPAIEHALSSSVHAIWTPQMFGKTILSRKMLCDVQSTGMKSGLTIPVRDHRGSVASINFSGRSREVDSFWTEERIGYLYFLASNLHDAISRSYLYENRFSNVMNITQREQDILTYAAHGKTNWELSRIFNIAESTIEYHLKNIRSKLDASNTTHAIFKAAQMNLIDPILGS